MKVRTSILIIVLLITTTAIAQHKPFQFGFKGAVNLGWFATDAEGYNNEGTDFGGSWGFTADFFLMENYSITSGFDIVYLNSSISFPDHKPHEILTVKVPGISTRSYKNKYVEIPIIFTMKTNEMGKLRYFAQIGFGMGFLISSKAEENFVADDNSMTTTESLNTYDDLRFTRESLIIGAGVEIPIKGSTYLRSGIKFDNAFVNIFKGYNHVYTDVKNNGKNNYIEINVSVFF